MKNETLIVYSTLDTVGADGHVSSTKAILYENRVRGGTIIAGDFKFPNPWNYEVSYIYHPTGQVRYDKATYVDPYPSQEWNLESYLQGSFSGVSSPPPLLDRQTDLAYNLALDKLNEAVRGSLDLGVAVAESKQTIQMIAKATQLLTGGLFKVALTEAKRALYGVTTPYGRKKKVFFPRTRRRSSVQANRQVIDLPKVGSVKDIANGFLEYKYGWAPLMQDIFNIADELVRHAQTGLMYYHSSHTIEETVGSNDPQLVLGIPDRLRAVTQKARSSVRFKIVLAAEPTGFDAARWSSLNPLSLGWELVPFSFVVDWVYDIGSYLRSMETAFAYQNRFVSGYFSELYVAESRSAYGGGSPYYYLSGDRRASIVSERSYQSAKSFRRVILSSYPFPRKPVLKVDLGAGKLLTLAALFSQRLFR